MTREETQKLLAVLRVAYPTAYRDFSRENLWAVVNLWAMQFCEVPAELVNVAVQRLISKSKYPPTVAEVNTELDGMLDKARTELLFFRRNPEQMDGGEAYNRRIVEALSGRKQIDGFNLPLWGGTETGKRMLHE